MDFVPALIVVCLVGIVQGLPHSTANVYSLPSNGFPYVVHHQALVPLSPLISTTHVHRPLLGYPLAYNTPQLLVFQPVHLLSPPGSIPSGTTEKSGNATTNKTPTAPPTEAATVETKPLGDYIDDVPKAVESDLSDVKKELENPISSPKEVKETNDESPSPQEDLNEGDSDAVEGESSGSDADNDE